MGKVDTVDALFRSEYSRLIRALSVAFDAETAADAVQEAFLEADRRWHRVGRYEDPAAWVRRVAVNRASNQRRNRKRRAEILQTISPAAPEEQSDALLDLHHAVASLAPQMRLTVTLFYLADLSVAETAQALGVSEGTVKSNLHDARKRLRLLLQEDRHE